MANANELKKAINQLKKELSMYSSNSSNFLKKLKEQQQIQEYLRLTGRQPVPSKTPYFNKTMRRFFYDQNKGFYVVLGMKNGKQVIRQMPGLFYYKNIGWRIVPIRPRRR